MITKEKGSEEAMEISQKDREILELKDRCLALHEQLNQLQQEHIHLLKTEEKPSQQKPSRRHRVLEHLISDRGVHKCGHRGMVMLLYIAHKCDLVDSELVTIDAQEFAAETKLISNDAIGVNRQRCVDAGYLKFYQEHRNRPSQYELLI